MINREEQNLLNIYTLMEKGLNGRTKYYNLKLIIYYNRDRLDSRTSSFILSLCSHSAR